MTKISPIQFFRQVKQEVKKVTWPTRKEVVQTSIMVLVIVAIVVLVIKWNKNTVNMRFAT